MPPAKTKRKRSEELVDTKALITPAEAMAEVLALHGKGVGPSSIAVRVGLKRSQVVEILRRRVGYHEPDDIVVSGRNYPKRRY